MKFKVETHLALLILYSIVVNIKSQANFIDGIIIVSILASMLYHAKLEHDTLPDIRSEVESTLKAYKEAVDADLKNLHSASDLKFKLIEKEASDLKNTVAPLVGGRSVGMSNAQIRF